MHIDGHARVLGRRMWFVPDVSVWGTRSLNTIEYLTVESTEAGSAVMFGTATIGEGEQMVRFDELIDHRGNQLPSQLQAPRVIVRPRNETMVFVSGNEASDHFHIAKESSSEDSVLSDLLIVEMGD